MFKVKLTSLFALALCSLVALQIDAQSSATLFVQASGGFSTALTAAIVKKHVPIVVTADEEKAQYTLQAVPVDSKDESGAGKVARCMFLDCVGVNGYSEVSVELVRNRDKAIVWAYQVRKANSGPMGIQSLSEAIAKHLKNDYLDKHSEDDEQWHP